MRGAPTVAKRDDLMLRIIPADAGSTIPSATEPVPAPDHPRGCGEHLAGTDDMLYLEGSSPRMRGAPCSISKQATARRIIPADAGSTLHTARKGRTHGDHPRGCGEHT